MRRTNETHGWAGIAILAGGFAVAAVATYAMFSLNAEMPAYVRTATQAASSTPVLDKKAYDRKMLAVAFATTTVSERMLAEFNAPAIGTSTATTTKHLLWPVRTAYPNYGAILPFHRIIAYYGNFYSKQMGVLGEYDTETMLAKLRAEVAKWNAADPTTPVMPAIDYIAVTAQAAPIDGTYRARMPDKEIDKAVELAKQVNGIVILDVQVGLSTVQTEIPLLEKYLKMPQVHLAIDPEFSMKSGAKPGTEIGTFDAADINWTAQYLAKLVRENNLPPKVLVIHRFTQAMVKNYKQIKPLPEVQMVIDMDGWGPPEKKLNTYNTFIVPEPVQFTGFKLFYKNDLRAPSTRLLSPQDLLKLKPQPLFIQFQ